jgi:uncharacterized membrane protein
MSVLANPRAALTAMFALATVSSLVLLSDRQISSTWIHWVGSLLAIAAALGIVVIAELTWHRAVTTAMSAGLVALDLHE